MQILFVSENDRCRGPMARVLAQRHSEEMAVGGATFDSAGVTAANGLASEHDFVVFLYDHKLNIRSHRSKALLAPQIRAAELILCMTHDIAARTRVAVGTGHAGKVVVLNDAVGFGKTAKDMDIRPPTGLSNGELMAVYSQLKASTGRLVRMLGEGVTTAADFGATVSAESAGERYLADPHLRAFLGRYVIEFIERAFEPPAVAQICRALELMGRPLSVLDVEELLMHDLASRVQKLADGRWELAPPVKEEPRHRQTSSNGSSQAKQTEQQRRAAPPPPKKEERKMSIETALEILTITLKTPRADAQKTYRKLLTRYHPDKFHDDDEFRALAEEKARRINIAWGVVEERLPAE